MELVISFFAIFGLAFLLKDSDGPWGIMNWFRRTLFNLPKVGSFFIKLFDCYFCLGCHCGWIIYLLSAPSFSWQFFVIWTLAGGAISLILEAALSRLQRE